MVNLIRKFFTKIFFTLIPKTYLLEQLGDASTALCKSQVTLGIDSRFYPEATVENIKNIKTDITIGTNSHIRGELMLYKYGQSLSIGDNCYIGKWSVIRCGEKIIIGNNVLIAHNVTIIDSDSHEIDYKERAESFVNMVKQGYSSQKGNIETAPIIIADNVWVSYNVSILKGVTIGEGAIVGAGSVVTKDVPAWTVVAGNPARVVKALEKPNES